MMKIDLSKTIKKQPEPKKTNHMLQPFILSIGLVVATIGLTAGLVKFTGVNAMTTPEVDSYEAVKDEHIALLEMEPDEFFDAINSGKAGITVNLSNEKVNKSKKELQEEIETLKQELQDVIEDATKTERELKAQLKDSTNDISENRKEIKAEYEQVIQTYEETEKMLREENKRLSNHVESQQTKIEEDRQTIQNQAQTIQQLKRDLRAVEAREQDLINKLKEAEGTNNAKETNREY